ncbi:MAG TPA: amidohydrolase family protein [Vicinamibacterales bacterium]|nr:amidohydrolase family protein [Vicinamibacterales bacterium]
MFVPSVEAHLSRQGTHSSVVFGLALVAAVLIPSASPEVSGQAAQNPAVVAIRNATLVTVSHGTINNGTIVLRDGKIVALGENVPVPAGATVVDGTGKFVTPGLIDAHSHIGNDAINEGATAVSSMTDMGQVLNPTNIAIQRDLAGGLTTANILHGSANPIGGGSVTIKLRWGVEKGDDLIFQGAMPGIKFALGENPKRQGGGAGGLQGNGPARYPATRQGVEFVIRDAFTRAKKYQKDWAAYNAATKAGQTIIPPRRDLQLDALVEVLEGKRLVHVHSYRADEILMMIRLADEMGFKVATFQHVLEGYKVAKEIAAHGAGASTFSDWWGYKAEAANAIPGNAGLMTHKGVTVSVNSDSAEHARRLNTEAAKSVRWGDVSDDQAMAMVTLNPAKQLRIDNRVGTLDVGKDADVVIWNNHPLSTFAIVEQTYIDGKVYYDRVADLARAAEAVKQREALSGGRSGGADSAPAVTANLFNITPEAGKVLSNANGATWAITNARIYPVSGPVIPKGTVVIKGNVIQAVGATAAIPSGARVVDAKGGSVYPGFIDAQTDLGINEPGVRSYDDVNEMLPFNQMLRTRVAYQSDSEAIPVARTEGITSAGIFPGGGIIGGEVPLMNLDGWTWEENVVRPSAGLAFSFPGGGGGGRGGGFPAGGRAGGAANSGLRELDTLLAQAKVYGSNPARDKNWNLEPFLPLINKQQAFYISAGSDNAITQAIAWAQRQNVNIVIRTSPATAVSSAAALKAANVPVILSSVLALPPSDDAFHAATYQAAGELEKAGVTFAFSSGGFETVRLIPFQAAMSVAWGLSKDRALQAMTLDAAKIFGADKLVGSIEPGKVANLVVTNGDAMEIRTRVLHVVIAGKEIELRNKQTELFNRYMGRQ